MTETKTPSVPLWVRIPRYAIPAFFVLLSPLAVFIFPFMFDDPKTDKPGFGYLVLATFLSPIFGFFLAEWFYRRATAAQQWWRALALIFMPVALPFCMWLILIGYLGWADH